MKGLIGYGYDMLSSIVWLPSKSKLYEQLLIAANVESQHRVLELGCGSGYLTRRLVEGGARVTAVDQSEGMLLLAKKRAPAADFIKDDIVGFNAEKEYDIVVLFFVLHELDKDHRKKIITSARSFLSATGKIVIADFSTPDKGLLKWLFPRIIRLWERSGSSQTLNMQFVEWALSSGWNLKQELNFRNGRVKFLTLEP